MPDYHWDGLLPAAMQALFEISTIARDVVITGGVAMADWWASEA
jgi:hypothetical protein